MFVLNCLQLCKEQHPKCQKRRDAWLPPRLLKIENGGITLIDSTILPPETTFVALSYCWGSKVSLFTTASNISEFRLGIPYEIIPNVLRDAITFTLKIGETYLWADRLCIQQDDPDDWAFHASIMDKVYALANVTVCAVSSTAVDELFLGSNSVQNRQQVAATLITIQGEKKDSEYRVWFRDKSLDIDYQNGPVRTGHRDKGPLDLRGWTFQERFLSNRSVRYEDRQIVWECSTITKLEMFPFDLIERPLWLQFNSDATISQWESAVSEFTSRSLSYGSDRLPAISGLAARYQTALKTQYHAGLWSGYVIEGLLWAADHNLFTASAQRWRFHHVRIVPQVPSWSWASILLPIVKAPHQTRLRRDEEYSHVTLIQILCKPMTSNPFGAVHTPASLRLRGPLIDASLRRVSDFGNLAPKYRLIFNGEGKTFRQESETMLDSFIALKSSTTPHPASSSSASKVWRRVNRDEVDEPKTSDVASVKILAIVAHSELSDVSTSYDTIWSLILSPLDLEMKCFERLGVVQIRIDKINLLLRQARAKPSVLSII